MFRFTCVASLLFVMLLAKAGAPIESNNARILKRAAQLLPDEAHWNRADTRECPPNANKLSLYCGLRQATEEVMGQSVHRTSAMEEVRAVIGKKTGDKKYDHRLMGYNNDPTTTLSDIRTILQFAAEQLQKHRAVIVPRAFELLNDGKGHFTAHDLSPSADRTSSAALADLDGDGHLDLVVSNDQSDSKVIYRNDGKGDSARVGRVRHHHRRRGL